jgi:hypothetical protein
MDRHHTQGNDTSWEPHSNNNKRQWSSWNDGEGDSPLDMLENTHNNSTSRSPLQAFKRLKVTQHDEDGDLLMNSPPRMFPQTYSAVAAYKHSQQKQQQEHQPQYTAAQHHGGDDYTRYQQTAGQQTYPVDDIKERHATPQQNHGGYAPDPSYSNVNSVLGQLHQQRLERERHQFAIQNQSYLDAIHHPANNRSPVGLSQSPRAETASSFHTPPARRKKGVVHLHTDSKLR